MDFINEYLNIQGVNPVRSDLEIKKLIKSSTYIIIDDDNDKEVIEEINSKHEVLQLFKDKNLDINNLVRIDSYFQVNNYAYIYRGVPLLFINTPGIKKALKLTERLKVKIDNYFDNANEDFSSISMYIHQGLNKYFINNFYWILKEDRKETFKDLYISCEYNFKDFNEKILKDAFTLSEEEIKYLNGLSANGFLTIYRGECSKSSKLENAHSWTLSKKIAKWFSTRFDTGNKTKIYKAKIAVDKVIGYSNERKEEEILVNFHDLQNIIEL